MIEPEKRRTTGPADRALTPRGAAVSLSRSRIRTHDLRRRKAPTAQVFPFDVTTPYPTVVGGRETETYHQWMGVVLPWSLAGTPVMNLPAGFSADGLPMGVQLIGKRQSELPILQMSRAYEEATQWVRKNPPPILG